MVVLEEWVISFVLSLCPLFSYYWGNDWWQHDINHMTQTLLLPQIISTFDGLSIFINTLTVIKCFSINLSNGHNKVPSKGRSPTLIRPTVRIKAVGTHSGVSWKRLTSVNQGCWWVFICWEKGGSVCLWCQRPIKSQITTTDELAQYEAVQGILCTDRFLSIDRQIDK